MEDNVNYCIISNKIDANLLNNLEEYNIINDDKTYEELLKIIANYVNKKIVFNDILRKFRIREQKTIMELLKLRNVNFINITSDIEEALYADYLYVLDQDVLVMEGKTSVVLKEEKILKRIGYGLPFATDLATQLIIYNVLDKPYYDLESLVHDLWI